jgi:hypothetical protein
MPSLAKATVQLWDNKIVDRFKTLGGGVSNVITNLEVSVSKMMVVCMSLSVSFQDDGGMHVPLYLPFGDVFSFQSSDSC